MDYARGIASAIAKFSVLVFTTWQIITSQTGSSTQHSRSNLFRQYFTDIIREVDGRKFKISEM